MNYLNPKITDVHYLSLKKKAQVLSLSTEEILKNKKNLDILDVGCGSKPYKELFSSYAKTYIGLDASEETQAEIYGSAENIPLEDNSFDVILCFQVLEHVQDYRAAIKEMHRLLRPKGVLFLTTHGTYPIHGAPNDYWRFTNFGLEEAFKNFKNNKVTPIGGSVLGFIQIFNLAMRKSKKIPLLGFLFNIVIVINNLIFIHIDKIIYDDLLPLNYLLIAEK